MIMNKLKIFTLMLHFTNVTKKSIIPPEALAFSR